MRSLCCDRPLSSVFYTHSLSSDRAIERLSRVSALPSRRVQTKAIACQPGPSSPYCSEVLVSCLNDLISAALRSRHNQLAGNMLCSRAKRQEES